MKAALRMLTLLLGLMLLWAARAPAQQAEVIYTDPNGRYTVQVPTGWAWLPDPSQDFVLITDPEAATRIYLLALPGNDAEQGIATAWARVNPAFNLQPRNVIKAPAPAPFEQEASIIYGTPRERVVQAIGRLLEGQVYVFLVDAPLDAMVKRQAQIGIVLSSFDVKAVKTTDLSNVTPKALDEAIGAGLDRYIPEAMKLAKVPGAVVAVVQHGRVVYQRAFGLKELGRPEPMTVDTQLMIGSTGKSLTTMMMATLVDDGMMTWDTPAQAILPDFAVADPALSKTITVRNLVCACTGVPRRDYELLFNTKTAEDVVRSLGGFEFFTKFGEAFQYSNQMVAAGGYVAAVAGGASPDRLLEGYALQLHRRVLRPIGMKDTTLSFSQVLSRGRYASPHGLDLFNQQVPIPHGDERMLQPIAPAGGHWSTVPDLTRYLITLLQRGVAPDGRRVVSGENLEVTWTPQVKISADVSYGLGWMVGRFKGVRYVQHDGNTFGFTSGLAFLPDRDLGVVVLTNGRGTNFFNDHIINRVFNLLYGRPLEGGEKDYAFGLEQMARALEETADTLQGEVDPAVVTPYLGAFSNPALGQIRLSLADTRLRLDTGEFRLELRRRVDREGRVGYIAVDPPLTGLLLEFGTDEAGRIVITMYSPPDNYRFTRR